MTLLFVLLRNIIIKGRDVVPYASSSTTNFIHHPVQCCFPTQFPLTGLSSWEIFHQRDQFSGKPINMPDDVIRDAKAKSRETNHIFSAKHKARGGPLTINAAITVGCLVYIKSEHDKTKPRDRYIVVTLDRDSCSLQKLLKSQIRSKRYDLKLTEVEPVVTPSNELDMPLPQSLEESDSDTVDIELPEDQVPTNDRPRRSTRNRNQPLWMRSGDFVLNGEELENEE